MNQSAAVKRGYMAPSGRDDWRTPDEEIRRVEQAFGQTVWLDPCASADREHWFAQQNLCLPHDGLEAEWGKGPVFVNPPFSKLRRWVAKCQAEHEARHSEILLLMAARTDTAAWHVHVASASAVCLLQGRIRFVGAKHGCPFPIAFVYWGHHVKRFTSAYEDQGMVFRP